jgi:uncharacterized membrane protein
MLQIALGSALLAIPEAPVVAATLALMSGAAQMIAGTLVLLRVRASSTLATLAFAISSGAAAYAAWVATPYRPGTAVIGVLTLCGLVAALTQRPSPPETRLAGAPLRA